MRTLEALKKLAAKLTNKNVSAVTGTTVDEVIEFANANLNLTANGLVLKSPDNSLWDVAIANDGTISATKRS